MLSMYNMHICMYVSRYRIQRPHQIYLVLCERAITTIVSRFYDSLSTTAETEPEHALAALSLSIAALADDVTAILTVSSQILPTDLQA